MVRFNDNNEIIKDEEYRAILVGLQLNEDISYSMEELAGLAEAAGVEVLGQLVQNLERPNSATFIGKGKVQELAELCSSMEADMVIFNDELSGMQLRNLEDHLNVRVIDRTILILDIFAARATSKEGKLQVELAQLQYRMPRLLGFGQHLSRLGGGIGTRGPGEKKLETDRRHIAKRMDDIRKELAQIKNTRSVQRSQREKSEIPVVALMGYTNSGKSALMNQMLSLSEKEDKIVMEKDMLFATLDTQQRSIHIAKRRYRERHAAPLPQLRRIVKRDLKAVLLRKRCHALIRHNRHAQHSRNRAKRLHRPADHRPPAIIRKQFIAAEAAARARRKQRDAEPDSIHTAHSFSPSSSFSGVMGRWRTRTPQALYTASAMAGAGVLITHSPIDFAPKGPVGS